MNGLKKSSVQLNNLINTVSMRCSSIYDENEHLYENSKFHQVGGKSYDN